jgi:hypothetical protein
VNEIGRRAKAGEQKTGLAAEYRVSRSDLPLNNAGAMARFELRSS